MRKNPEYCEFYDGTGAAWLLCLKSREAWAFSDPQETDPAIVRSWRAGDLSMIFDDSPPVLVRRLVRACHRVGVTPLEARQYRIAVPGVGAVLGRVLRRMRVRGATLDRTVRPVWSHGRYVWATKK